MTLSVVRTDIQELEQQPTQGWSAMNHDIWYTTLNKVISRMESLWQPLMKKNEQ